MNNIIYKIAQKKLEDLKDLYSGFINVGLDNWRGWRFIYDTEDVRKCQNKCSECTLYKLLKDEKEGQFTTGLIRANKKDKEIFGPQNYLNCKTISQYKNCYVSYLLKETNTKTEMIEELKLLKNYRTIYCTENKSDVGDFYNDVIKKFLSLAGKKKKARFYKALQEK
ncbi:MAG: hypothetical protein V1838_02200 [Patescibacteria group bacterium]